MKQVAALILAVIVVLWVRAIGGLRRRGVAALVVLLDRGSFAAPSTPEERDPSLAAVRHALAEYDIPHHLVARGDDIAAVIGGRRRPAVRERSGV